MFEINRLFALVVLITLVCANKPACPCAKFTPCQIIQQADAVIIGLINSQTSNSMIISVQTSFKGSLTVGQSLTVFFNPSCLKFKTQTSMLLSLHLQGDDLWVDNCGFHQPRKQIPAQLSRTLGNIEKSCPSKTCVDSQGNVYSEGQTWNPLPCEFCSCHDGESACAMIDCARPPCDNYYVPAGKCCPVCPPSNECITENGQLIPSGQTWHPNPCQTCTCNNGTSSCLAITCPKPSCDNPVRAPNRCCPACVDQGSCTDKDGNIFDEGQVWNPTPCDTCRCDAGKINCQTEDCPDCKQPVWTKDQCCCKEACPPLTCDLDCGNYVHDENGCPTCKCLVCTIACVLPACKNPVRFPGECCPKCPVDCSGVGCPDLGNCQSWTVPTNQCCPVCLD